MRDVEHALGLPVIGVIPDLLESRDAMKRRRRRSIEPHGVPGARHIVVVVHPDFPSAQTFRLLASNIEHHLGEPDTEGSMLLVTSTGRGEGKSIVAANLAAVFAQKKWRTLLVDTHREHPTLHLLFHTSAEPGLTEALMRGVSLAGVLSRRNEPDTFLDVIAAGGPAAGGNREIDEEEALRTCFEGVRRYYRLIILDGPAVLHEESIETLGRLSDHVLFVVRSQQTPLRDASDALLRLEQMDRRPCGAVLNDATLPRDWNLRPPIQPQ